MPGSVKGDDSVGSTELNTNKNTLVSRLMHMYRSVWCQIIITGIVAFACPSMWDAIANTGGGGQQTPYVANTATCVLYSLMFLFCLIGGPIINTLGLRTSLVLGTIGYPLYGAGLYCNSAFGTQWFLLFGCVFCGISAALWYVTESTIILTYPPDEYRGRMIAVWLSFRNGGSIIAGAMTVALNRDRSTAGSVSLDTYLVFIGLMCMGFLVAFFLSDPAKVRRSDGSPVPYNPDRGTIRSQFKLLWKACINSRNLLLLPFFFVSYFSVSVMGTFNTRYLSVRARALDSLLGALAGIAGSFVQGFLLDYTKMSRRLRAKTGYFWVFAWAIATNIWLVVVQADYRKNPVSGIDYTDSEYPRSALIYVFSIMAGQLCQNFIYWLISCFISDNQTNARHAGVFRAVEAAGQAVSYGVNSAANTDPFVGIGMLFGLWILAIIPTFIVVMRVPENSLEVDESDESIKSTDQVAA